MTRNMDSEDDYQRIQQDIDQREIWVEKWQVVFNPAKMRYWILG